MYLHRFENLQDFEAEYLKCTPSLVTACTLSDAGSDYTAEYPSWDAKFELICYNVPNYIPLYATEGMPKVGDRLYPDIGSVGPGYDSMEITALAAPKQQDITGKYPWVSVVNCPSIIAKWHGYNEDPYEMKLYFCEEIEVGTEWTNHGSYDYTGTMYLWRKYDPNIGIACMCTFTMNPVAGDPVIQSDGTDLNSSTVYLEDYHERVLKYNKYKVDYNFKNK